MIPAAFDYVRAGSADEALQLLSSHGEDAKLLAGGHSLIPLMKLRLASPAVLIDVARVRDLSYIRDGGDHIAIGALLLSIPDLPLAMVVVLHAGTHIGPSEVVRMLNPVRDATRNPLVGLMFSFNDAPLPQVEFGAASGTVFEAMAHVRGAGWLEGQELLRPQSAAGAMRFFNFGLRFTF